jgi:hypothetical protein
MIEGLSKWVAEVRRLRQEHPTWSHKKIARVLAGPSRQFSRTDAVALALNEVPESPRYAPPMIRQPFGPPRQVH